MHIKKLDWVDLTLKLSSELFVLILTLLAVGFNLYFFTGDIKNKYNDQSYAAKFLSFHTDLNKKLYTRNASVVTTVFKQAGLISEVQAQDLETLNNNYLTEENEDNENADMFSYDILTRPTPDSIKDLIAKQIKVYETKPGDTLSFIAQQNGINQQTLMWANKLTSEAIKPGWFLLIPPTDGVIYKANTNDTLPDLAKKYKADLDIIIAYNGLENAEDIDGGQILIIPDGQMPAPPKPKVALPSSQSGKVKPGGVTKPAYVNNGTGHIFPWGYCTWYVASRVHIPWGGNAKNWLTNAKNSGALITNSAIPGALVVTTDNRRWGHVAYVESVDDNGFTVSEMNYEKFGRVNTRWIPHGSKIIRGFIIP